MSKPLKITIQILPEGLIRPNGWLIAVLIVIVYFFWKPLLIIGGILAASWLFYRNR